MANETDQLFASLPEELQYTLKKWMKITIKELRDSLRKKRVREYSGDLYRSFTGQIYYGADGMPTKVTIGFMFHGRFIDMGVGRGVKMENVKSNLQAWRALTRGERETGRKAGQEPRKPKKWYSPTIYREYQRAAEILAGKYGIEIPARFESFMTQDVNIAI